MLFLWGLFLHPLYSSPILIRPPLLQLKMSV